MESLLKEFQETQSLLHTSQPEMHEPHHFNSVFLISLGPLWNLFQERELILSFFYVIAVQAHFFLGPCLKMISSNIDETLTWRLLKLKQTFLGISSISIFWKESPGNVKTRICWHYELIIFTNRIANFSLILFSDCFLPKKIFLFNGGKYI